MGYELAMKALVLSLVLGAVAGIRPSKIVRQVPAIYVFGDSTLDVGNNNHLPGKDVPRADKPYYGIDLPGSGKPTGRFSNGYNTADFVAKTLGFDKSPLAYLVLKERNNLIPSAITRGVSYASAGAGILDSTNAGNCIPLSKQVRFFESTKAEMEAKVGTRVVSDLLARSFFLVGVGSNDFFAFATAQAKQNKTATQSDVAAFYDSLLSNYSTTITELYKLGARKFGIINVGPVGCAPRVRVLNATGACADGLNQLAAGFDGVLGSLLAGLAPKLPGLAYSLADSLGLAQATFTNPLAHGFVSSDSACCGSGRLGAQGECLPTATLCANRDRYIFWDSVHPSQRSAMISAQVFYDGPAQYTTPVTFKQLAHKA
ncbi:GDSL esterase/lipase At1g71691-like [Phragmites australis]|uniref:GDSL esterase/lipase At1g71691-like n=1 Tax=Phragmites australis TaxID=29695 RepID=UPI002D785D56|nr:GDSL esterase/lipase At1g71691-like [Phragmites australis]